MKEQSLLDSFHQGHSQGDSMRLITGSADQSVKLWNVQTGAQLYTFSFASPTRSVDLSIGDQLAVITTDPFMEQTAAIHVSETAGQVGRISVSTPDVPYREMANHCESLLAGKQEKMSVFMNAQAKQENSLIVTPQYHTEVKLPASSQMDQGFSRSGNPFLEQIFFENTYMPCNSASSMLCLTDYQQHPQFYMLPASSPYDNFLKAAGC